MSTRKYHVRRKRFHSFSAPIFGPFLFCRRDEHEYLSLEEALKKADKGFKGNRVIRRRIRDSTINLLYEIRPQWGAHESQKWKDYNDRKIPRDYLSVRISPVN